MALCTNIGDVTSHTQEEALSRQWDDSILVGARIRRAESGCSLQIVLLDRKAGRVGCREQTMELYHNARRVTLIGQGLWLADTG